MVKQPNNYHKVQSQCSNYKTHSPRLVQQINLSEPNAPLIK
jgi:hypothetical protein